MTEHSHYTLPAEWLDHIQAQGLEALPDLLTILLNAAMRAEREHHLRARPYEHAPARTGHANGFKPKRLRTRLGELIFQGALGGIQCVMRIRGECTRSDQKRNNTRNQQSHALKILRISL